MVYEDPALKYMNDKIDERETKLMMEHTMSLDALDSFIQMHTNLIRKHELHKARMKKYEWIETLLQTATRFLRYLLPKHTTKV